MIVRKQALNIVTFGANN